MLTMCLRYMLPFLVCFLCCNGELFTSLHRMEEALRKDVPNLYDDVNLLVKKQTRNLSQLKSIIKSLKLLHRELTDLQKESDGNPLVYYRFSADFSHHWNHLQNLIYNKEIDGLRTNILDYRSKLPTHKDKVGLMDNIIKAQKVYNFNVTEWTSGHIIGRATTSLSAKDCYDFGKRMFLKSMELMSTRWFEAVLNKLASDPSQARARVRDFDNVERDLTRDVVMNAQKIAMESHDYKMQVLKKMKPPKNESKPGDDVDLNSEHEIKVELSRKLRRGEIKYAGADQIWNLEQMISYAELCQGLQKRNLTAEDLKIIRCFFAVHKNPYFMLRRIKVEMINLNPLLFILHDVVYESEIKAMKDEVLHRMERSVVRSRKKIKDSNTRISISAYLEENGEMATRLNKRLTSMINVRLQPDNVEGYKVSNYGPAGPFDPHIDYWADQKIIDEKSVSGTNRLLTLLTYLSEVEFGGSTVFPWLHIAVSPIRGSLLIFQNLKEDGMGNIKALHASCPVIFGNKWIVSKYVHAKGQDMSELTKFILNEHKI